MDNDLISRSALKTQIKRVKWLRSPELKEIVHLVNTAPAVDAAPVVHGRWEVVENYGKTALYRCTACKSEMVDYVGREGYHLYCHVCGAPMDGGEGDG